MLLSIMKDLITCTITTRYGNSSCLGLIANTRKRVKEGYVNGFVAVPDVDKVLELHERACLTDYVKR